MDVNKSTEEKEVDPGSKQFDPKYKNYVTAMDKALKNFEYSSEWPDLIAALSKLNKVISQWSARYPGDLPRLHLVTKRLSQCLHPNLPSGVHLKALETYELIFKSIPSDKLTLIIRPELFSFAAGLFPLWRYASEQLRPTLLQIYEKYLLDLLRPPALSGFLISILSDGNEEAFDLLEKISCNIGQSTFNRTLWEAIKYNCRIRLAGINFILSRSALTDRKIAMETLIACLNDEENENTNESVLVQRSTLELLLKHFKLDTLQPKKEVRGQAEEEESNTESDCDINNTTECNEYDDDVETRIRLITASLRTLLRRDMSLNRRLFSWLLGNDPLYFENHSKSELVLSLKEILTRNTSTIITSGDLKPPEIVRILISLLDKTEINILDEILLDILFYFRRIDSKQNCNLFFVNLKPDYVFERVLLSMGGDFKNYKLLEFIIATDLNCFEYETLLPAVFQKILLNFTVGQIVEMANLLKMILRKIETNLVFENFIMFYLRFVNFARDFNCFLKPMDGFEGFLNNLKAKEIEEQRQEISQNQDEVDKKGFHWKDFQENWEMKRNLETMNNLFQMFFKLKKKQGIEEDGEEIPLEITELTDWLKTLLVLSCHGDLGSIKLLLQVVKQLDEKLLYLVVNETMLTELVARFLWTSSSEHEECFNLLSDLLLLDRMRVEKIILSLLSDFASFEKLIEFFKRVPNFRNIQLLIFKVLENLESLDLAIKYQAEEFVEEMLNNSDIRFIQVFIQNLTINYNEEKRVENVDVEVEGDNDVDSSSSESDDEIFTEEELEVLKTNSTPDLTKLFESRKSLSKSLSDLVDNVAMGNHNHQTPQVDFKTVVPKEKLPSLINLNNNNHIKKEEKPQVMASREQASKELRRKFFSVKLDSDLENRVLYLLCKVERLVLLKPDVLISCLVTTSNNECSYLEVLLRILLDFMCLENTALQYRASQLLNLLLEKLIDFERWNSLGKLEDILIRTKLQKTLLSILQFNTNHIYQATLLCLVKTVISLEWLIKKPAPINSSKKTLSHGQKYIFQLPLSSQPIFHEILKSALEDPKQNHFLWMELNTRVLPYDCSQITLLTFHQICRNLLRLQNVQNTQNPPEIYIQKSLNYLITITTAVLFKNLPKIQKSAEPQGTTYFGIFSSFLTTTSATPTGGKSSLGSGGQGPEITVNNSTGVEMLGKLDLLITSCVAISRNKQGKNMNKLVVNLLNPICHNYLDEFLTSLSGLEPQTVTQLVALCKQIQTIKLDSLTLIVIKLLNSNLLLFYLHYVKEVEIFDFPPALLNSLVKEALGKGVALVTLVEIVMVLFPKIQSFSKTELKELQDNTFKILEKLVNNLQSFTDSSGGGDAVGNNQTSVVLKSLSNNLPAVVDLLWQDDKDRDKILPNLNHLVNQLLNFIKNCDADCYVSVLILLKNLSSYSYFRKAWKKEVFELLLLDQNFFQNIKNHERSSCIHSWKVMLDNLFTQDKSSFSELLTRVSVPQTLNIFSSKETEYEGRALLLKRLAFVIWSSEQDQFSKFITNIQERLAEALKTPQPIPTILKSVFLCFRVLILKFSNLSALWPIIIHELVQVLLSLENRSSTSGESSVPIGGENLALYLECFKLIELLSSLPPESLPLFQMYRWAFASPKSASVSEDKTENNVGFSPFLSRIFLEEVSAQVESSSINRNLNPSQLRSLDSLVEVYSFIQSDYKYLTIKELEHQLDLDFLES